MNIAKIKRNDSGANLPAKPTKSVAKERVSILPTEKTPAATDFRFLSSLIYGERKIGKTSFGLQFGDPLVLAFEKGYTGADTFVVPCFDKKEQPSWEKFVQAVDELVTKEHQFKTVLVDTADVAYAACMVKVCFDMDVEHPSDVPYGKAWKEIEKEFSTQINRLVNCDKFGVIFISHAQEKEVIDRAGDRTEKLTPSVAEQARKAISSVCDLIMFYGYFGEDRLITIRGSDTVDCGNRMKDRFWVKGKKEIFGDLLKRKLNSESQKEREQLDEELAACRVHSIPAGQDETETFINFVTAFNNEQLTCGKPKREFGYIEKKAPMKTKSK